MIRIESEKCLGCQWCSQDCPVKAIAIKGGKAVIDQQKCVSCGVCAKVCRYEAIYEKLIPPIEAQGDFLICDSCPIKCQIRPNSLGACLRYANRDGSIVRLDKPLGLEDVRSHLTPQPIEAIREPIITAVGVGTTTPDLRPAPAIIYQNRHGIDVVTVATEAPLSFSSVIVKVDTDLDIGRPGATVIFEGRKIGMLETEQYGSKMLHIGGAEQLTADQSGFAAARAVTDIVNRKVVKLRIKDGAQIEAQIGQAPIINGSAAGAMKVGCGSATIGLFAKNLLEAADDVIVVDSQITGQLSRHAAGLAAGAKPTGIELIFRESTPGRYFCESGPGIGGTDIIYPLDIIKRVDTKIAKIGSTVLITETTGQVGYMFTVKAGGLLIPMELTKKAALALKEIHDCCESSLVSAVYTGGAGGSARAGVCRHPPKLTKAIHQNKAVLTVAGAPAFVLPGGGINFFVDVGQIKPGSFYWTPTPATICPLEYTMRLEDYQEIGGHIEVMKPFTPQKYK